MKKTWGKESKPLARPTPLRMHERLGEQRRRGGGGQEQQQQKEEGREVKGKASFPFVLPGQDFHYNLESLESCFVNSR